MAMLWVIFVALAGPQLGHGLPLKSTPLAYPHDGSGVSSEVWGWETAWYAALPAVALVVAGAAALLGCTWCYRHKDCKPNEEGADNQLFSASATQLHDGRRSQPPDSGFSEPVNNNISEDNNNGPISLREMQNIANNNAAAYIVSENEERNRGRESVVQFEPLPAPNAIGVPDPLERCADWFATEDFPRERLQYLREFTRGWFGRVIETEMEVDGSTSIVAVKILNQNASLEDKARFLTEARVYRDARHENVLACRGHCLREDPWILIFDMYSMDLRQYLSTNRTALSADGADVALQLLSDVASALTYLHSRGHCAAIRPISSDSVLIKETSEGVRAVLGCYSPVTLHHHFTAPETNANPPQYSASSDVWELGSVACEVVGTLTGSPAHAQAQPAALEPLYQHLYQIMQMCWNPDPELRPTAAQVLALVTHLRRHGPIQPSHQEHNSDFEERWRRLKPNYLPSDQHVALIHAPSTSNAHPSSSDNLCVDIEAPPSRSSSVVSDRDLSHYKSESLNNLHGSLDDVRNIYLTHNETPVLECHQGNIPIEERECNDSSVDPWLKDIIAGSHDDVSYLKDVSDVIKNLDNILNSEKTSSSESSHQASPSRDNLSLDCKREYQLQSSLVKSPGITNFQNILEMNLDTPQDRTPCDDDEIDRDTIGTLSHSFERHSDTMSQHTLENLTPDTPSKDIDVVNRVECQTETVLNDLETKVLDNALESPKQDMPNEKVESSDTIPKLKELCTAAANSSVSGNKQNNAIEDCETPCDSKVVEDVRTEDKVETKSVITSDVTEITKEEVNKKHENVDSDTKHSIVNNSLPDLINDTLEIKYLEKPSSPVNEDLPVVSDKLLSDKQELVNIDQIATADVMALPSVQNMSCNIISSQTFIDNEKSQPSLPENKFNKENILIDSMEARENTDKENFKTDVTEKSEKTEFSQESTNLPEKLSPIYNTYIPELVQIVTENVSDDNVKIVNDAKTNETKSNLEQTAFSLLPPEEVQIRDKQVIATETKDLNKTEKDTHLSDFATHEGQISDIRSEPVNEAEHSNESTVYMDLNNAHSKIVSKPLDDNVKKVIDSCLEKSNTLAVCTISNNESTIYLDLPSVLHETNNFLQAEKVNSSQPLESHVQIYSSTPKASDSSDNTTLENSTKNSEALSETKVPSDECSGPFSKFELKYMPDISPFESPMKSHPTDTYDENSSVVLGPFENCSLELYKGGKCELVDLPKEELLAFSSNFSEINLATPSPLRDVNFLNEVPDVHFDDITTSEEKLDKDQTENTEESDQPGTAKRVSPSTPPNSPGIFLASTSQEKYLVNIDLETPTDAVQTYAPMESYPPIDSDSGLSSLQKEIDLNQIELTAKMAMAENENNMNIEYSGPLTVEGVVSEEDIVINDSDAFPEIFLAGNGGPYENEPLVMDEDCMKALRNELELKLPLAQVATIEPAVESDPESDNSWNTLPPPPELLVQYGAPFALSPIQEETRHQLTAYENDAWNASIRTDSSESYPEPCNNSTDDVTELPTGAVAAPSLESTYTVHSRNGTYTIQKDIPSSNEMTMSVDSLNGSPFKKPIDPLSPIDDRTYNKEDNKEESNCERLSQVSPFLMSPTEASAPGDSENVDNATGVSTLSKTTLPTDAKHSKASDCLSKATSIDSWCSNDTLYNVEENFDDLIMDPELQTELEKGQEKNDSESTDTLTHHDEDKDDSHCSTYIIHDSKSEICDTFSPDSINANDNNTYTKAKTVTGTTDVNDSTKNTQTKDLAYGTLPSYSNCTTELISGVEDSWKLLQPEMVRRSPSPDVYQITPPKSIQDKEQIWFDGPQTKEPAITKMVSVEIFCLKDDSNDSHNNTKNSHNQGVLVDLYESPKYNMNMAPSVTSTPILEEPVPENVNKLPTSPLEWTSQEQELPSLPNFQTFEKSAESRPQDTDDSNTTRKDNNDSVVNGSDTDLILASGGSPNKDSKINVSALVSPHEKNLGSTNTSLDKDDNNDTAVATEPLHRELLLAEGGLPCKNVNDSVCTIEQLQTDILLAGDIQSTNDIKVENASITESHNMETSKAADCSKINTFNKDTTAIEGSTNYSEFNHSASKKPQDSTNQTLEGVANSEHSTNYLDFKSSASKKPQDPSNQKPEHVSVTEEFTNYSNIEKSSTQSPQDSSKENSAHMSVTDHSTNYSDFKNSALQKPQDSSYQNSAHVSRTENSTNYSDFEKSAIQKQQDSNIQSPAQSSAVEYFTNYSDFKNSASAQPQGSTNKKSAVQKPLDSNSQSLVQSSAVEHSINCSDFKNSASAKPQDSTNMSSEHISNIERSTNYCDFENSASKKPQHASSQNSEQFRSFESSLSTRHQDLSFLNNATSLFLESERQFNDDNLSSNQSIGNFTPFGNQRILNNISSVPDLIMSQTCSSSSDRLVIDDYEDEHEQPHSIIITESLRDYSFSPERTYDSHSARCNVITTVPKDIPYDTSNRTFDSHLKSPASFNSHMEAGTKENNLEDDIPKINGVSNVEESDITDNSDSASQITNDNTDSIRNDSSSLIFDISGIKSTPSQAKDLPNGSVSEELSTSTKNTVTEVKCNGNSENFAIVNVLSERFEELMDNNVDDVGKVVKDFDKSKLEQLDSSHSLKEELQTAMQGNKTTEELEVKIDEQQNQKVNGSIGGTMVAATDNFLQNEKNFCQLDSYLPLLNDIRFTGPAAEIMSTSFCQESPTEPEAPEGEQDSKPDTITDLMKDWDSDSDSHSSNSSSGEFIWKDGEGHETALVPNTHFDHQRGSGGTTGSGGDTGVGGEAGEDAVCSGDSGSGSEGDEVEFVPSSWDCRAAPAKSSLRSLQQAAATPDNKKRVVFKRQKYHCVYEYPREVALAEHSPAAYMPDFSTYCDWEPSSAEDVELGYGQLFGGSPLDMYPLRAGIAFGADFDEDFFISSSARPFESLSLVSSGSEFFPGLRHKLPPAPPHAPPFPAPALPTTPSLDFTTPDSGVEDITPQSTSVDEDFANKLPETELTWRPTESGSSSESVSPSSPGGEALGGLRHTRDKLKLDLPPSPHIPSPRHSRVFNFVLDKPKRRRSEDEETAAPLILTDDTPVITSALSLPDDEEVEIPEPTFSTFGKCQEVAINGDAEQRIVLTDGMEVKEVEVKEESPMKSVEGVKGEGTVLDSGDEDSGIESSSKATLERDKPPHSCPN